ncbi:hypothetical protein NK718_12825 [Alsobacter sp. SYSU M60028]|uniref:Uncharacterized protein n=1 Tax=Alsobacter ponti TaxID=2962936 RepID=A0ABT1LE57_9HYPH|nr:hypothetical protein [Alsobacter ponti]MCP8939401.1 hypothetical protein [Alsobacter ponti]
MRRDLPILDRDGHLSIYHWLIFHALLAWPNSSVKRSGFISSMKAQVEEGLQEGIPANDLMMNEIYGSWMPLRRAMPAGCLVGDMLLYLVQFAINPECPRLSMRKARHLVLSASQGATTINGHAVPQDESTLKRTWREKKDVSHLYAGWILVSTDEYLLDKYKNISDKREMMTERFLDLISIAEYISELANSYDVVSDWNPWRCPEPLLNGSKVAFSPPSAPVKKALSRYRAPSSYR